MAITGVASHVDEKSRLRKFISSRKQELRQYLATNKTIELFDQANQSWVSMQKRIGEGKEVPAEYEGDCVLFRQYYSNKCLPVLRSVYNAVNQIAEAEYKLAQLESVVKF